MFTIFISVSCILKLLKMNRFFFIFFFFVTTCWTFSTKKIRKTTSKKGALVNKKSQYINLTTL